MSDRIDFKEYLANRVCQGKELRAEIAEAAAAILANKYERKTYSDWDDFILQNFG